jgi:hypothetical protein
MFWTLYCPSSGCTFSYFKANYTMFCQRALVLCLKAQEVFGTFILAHLIEKNIVYCIGCFKIRERTTWWWPIYSWNKSLLRLLMWKHLLAIQILIVVFDCIYRYRNLSGQPRSKLPHTVNSANASDLPNHSVLLKIHFIHFSLRFLSSKSFVSNRHDERLQQDISNMEKWYGENGIWIC